MKIEYKILFIVFLQISSCWSQDRFGPDLRSDVIHALDQSDKIGFSDTDEDIYSVTRTLLAQSTIDASWAATQLMKWKKIDYLELGWWKQKNPTVRSVILIHLIGAVPADQKERRILHFEESALRFAESERGERLIEIKLAKILVDER